MRSVRELCQNGTVKAARGASTQRKHTGYKKACGLRPLAQMVTDATGLYTSSSIEVYPCVVSTLQGTLCKHCLKRWIEQETRWKERWHLYSSKKKLKT